jgi:hypothetical protein
MDRARLGPVRNVRVAIDAEKIVLLADGTLANERTVKG